MAGLFNGHLLEFPRIRVDSFSDLHPRKAPWTLPHPDDPKRAPTTPPNAQLYLLTHVHSDHLLGLRNAFVGRILCSPDTKRMLLRLESEKDKDHYHHGIREVKKRKYEGLCARQGPNGIVDYIETLNPGESNVFDMGMGEEVCITLLDANHCPGSSMFLVTSATRAVLHTGDVRADFTFRQTLRRIPQLQEFLVPSPSNSTLPGSLSPRRRLDRIYLDTSAFMGTGDMPEKESVLDRLMTQMSLYPLDTIFFLNVWCFGWEDVVKEVARSFDTKVHADRYKRSIYGAVQSDPFLLRCTTDDPHGSRFHACDRFNRCSQCSGKQVAGKLVVQVLMVEVKSAAWELQHQAFLRDLNQAAIGEGKWPLEIEVPIARHSPLPELQQLVKMFDPSALSPNTLVPDKKGIDYVAFPDLLRPALSPDAYTKTVAERNAFFIRTPRFGRQWLAEAQFSNSVNAPRLLENSCRESIISWPVGRSRDPQSDTRPAWRRDQLDRIAGDGAQSAMTSDHGPQSTSRASLAENHADIKENASIPCAHTIPTTIGSTSHHEDAASSPARIPSDHVKPELPSTDSLTSIRAQQDQAPSVDKSTRSNSPRFKRKRQDSSFHVNIPHLRDLTGSQSQ